MSRLIKTHPRLTIWLVALCIPLLTGCGEVINEYYISNHTDVDLTVSITPFYTENVDLKAGPLIADMQKSTRSSLQQSITGNQAEDTINFSLPPKTTLYLGFSFGGKDLFSQLEISSDSQRLMMNDDDYGTYFAVHDNFIGAIVHVLNFK